MDVSESKAPCVLLVDDTPSNLIALVAVLQPVGATLVEARSGQEAIELVAQNWFAAILIDVQMPAMDGFETAARIRASERGREVPILFLTAVYRDEAYALRGYGVGAADYITKPFDPAIVRARVKAFVDLFRQRERQRGARLETALNFAPALVSIFRVPDHMCEFGNAALRGLFGQREVVGSSAEELGATPEMIALFDRVATTGEPLALTEHALTVGPVERVFNMTLQPLRDDQGRVDAVVSFAIDVTEPVLARRALEQARERAEQASRVKDEFLAVVSHELRTPLSSWSPMRSSSRTTEVIVLDLMLPRVSGFNVARLLRADRRTRHTTIVAVTALASDTFRAQALAAGCDSVLRKPIVGAAVVAEIMRLLVARRAPPDSKPPTL